MSNPYEDLGDRIRGEIADVDRLVQRAVSTWLRAKKALQDQDVYLDSVALNLHGIYSGLERLFELTARHVDQNPPTGEVWHRDLLNMMAQEINDIRPAVISEDSLLFLDELRRFRHLVRNIYTFNLATEKIEPLIVNLSARWPQGRAELLAFADFLSDLPPTP